MFLSRCCRYVYLSYEFICTVQWEYDKAYTIFLSVTCFMTPLIVTVVCYISVMKVACRQAREKPPVTVGRFSESEPKHSITAIRDESNAEVPDGKKTKKCKNHGKIVCGKENRAFIADSKSGFREVSFSQGKSESTVANLSEHNNPGPSRVVKTFEQKTDPDHCKRVPGNPATAETGQDQTSHIHSGRINERKGKTSAGPSDSIGVIHLNPVVIVVSQGKSKISTGKGKHHAGASINPSGRIGKSRVSPAAVVSPVINRWTEEIPQGVELMAIKEDKRTDSKKNFTSGSMRGHLARMRGWMAERRTEDGRQRRYVRNKLLL